MERYLSPRPWHASELFPGNVADAEGDLVVERLRKAIAKESE